MLRIIRKMASYRCELECVAGRHAPIPLAHRQPITVGRSRETQIADKNVSKTQVELNADCIHKEVSVKVTGRNSSYIDGQEISKGVNDKLKSGATLYLLSGLHPHRVTFKLHKDKHKSSVSNTPGENKHESKKLKRPRSPSEEVRHDNKKMKTEVVAEQAMSDSEDEDERVRLIQARLQTMKDTIGPSSDQPTTSARPPSGGDEKDDEDPDRLGEPLNTPSWTEQDTLMVHKSKGLQASSKIAAFDIDSTIICTQSGRVFPTDYGDWRIMYAEIPGCLKKLLRDSYKIVFITNQMGIQRGKVKIPEYRQKVERIIAKLGVPVHVLVSKGAGPYRKPGLGMWNHLIHKDNDGIKVNKEKSIYIGDAAGRPKDWAPKKKKDFSCSDRLFALNAGVRFQTPEEYFLKQSKAKFNMPEFDPRKLDPKAPLLIPPSAKLVAGQQEIIVLVGFPASGKSHFAKEHLISKGYVHVNRDTMKTWQKCVEAAKLAVNQGKSVVVDNTNPDEESRKRYTDVASKYKVPCRCFVIAASLQQARHNERFREMTDKSHQTINDMVMNSYTSKFKEPSTAEGFTEVVRVNFIPKFKDKTEEKMYKQFLIDK